jgi:DNA-binding CsgD family transcriptional regulator
LARALAAIAGEFVGDIVRGRRAADARFVREDPDIAALIDLRADANVSDLPVSIRGYARLAAIARERLSMRTPVGPLTTMEIEILRLVAAGRKAPQIAVLLNRSPHTVRTHLRNASAKLEAHGRIDLLERARQLGILKESRATGLSGAST